MNQPINSSVDRANQPIPVKKQIIYALTEFGSNPVYTITLSFLTFFYTDVLGINAGAVGVIILISKLFDGISDILAGNIIDHTHTKKGSARPWVLRSAIPLAVSTFLLFTVPNCGDIGKLVYIFVTYNFSVTVSFTLFNGSINALPVFITNDTKSRSSALAVRLFLAAAIQTLLSSSFMNIIGALGGGQSAWVKFAFVISILTFVGTLIPYFFLEEAPISNQKAKENVPLLTAINSLLHNKYWIYVLLAAFFCVFHQVATLTFGVYYAKYILHDQYLAGNLILYHHLPALVVMFILPFLLQKGHSTRNISLLGGCMMMLGGIISLLSTEHLILAISIGFKGAGFGLLSSCLNGMLADTVDYGEWKTGVRCMAVTTCANTMGQKLGTGIGTALFGLALSMTGYDGLVEVQPATAISCINFMYTILPIIVYAAVIFLLINYRLDKELPQIQADLAKRHRNAEM